MKRLLIAAVLVGAVLAAVPARAVCQPGSISIKGGKPQITLPHCDEFPR